MEKERRAVMKRECEHEPIIMEENIGNIFRLITVSGVYLVMICRKCMALYAVKEEK